MFNRIRFGWTPQGYLAPCTPYPNQTYFQLSQPQPPHPLMVHVQQQPNYLPQESNNEPIGQRHPETYSGNNIQQMNSHHKPQRQEGPAKLRGQSSQANKNQFSPARSNNPNTSKSQALKQVKCKGNPGVHEFKPKPVKGELQKNFVTQQHRSPEHNHVKNLHLVPSDSSETYYISDMIRSFNEEVEQNPILASFREHIELQFQYVPIIEKIKYDDVLLQMRKLDIERKDKKYKKTVVFDLDETLVHCNEDESQQFTTKLEIVFPTGEKVEAGINVRKYAKEIVQHLADICEVMIFTASHECYANKVIDYLDPDNKIAARIFRDSCVPLEGGYLIKNLEVIPRDLKDLVLVDNSSYSYAHHLENGIPIISFYDNFDDDQLEKLEKFILQKILPAKDVREVISQAFKMDRFKEYETLEQAVNKLYCKPQ